MPCRSQPALSISGRSLAFPIVDREKTPNFGKQIVNLGTVLVTPPILVVVIRGYSKDPNGHYGYLGGGSHGVAGRYDEAADNYGYIGTSSYGVAGYASESGESAIYGSSTNGHAIHGYSTGGWAGYFNGDSYVDGALGINDNSMSYALELPNNTTNLIGEARATNWWDYSDNRIKFNQQPLHYGLSEILKLNPKSYDHHSSIEDSTGIHISDDYKKAIGLIAQELYLIIPEVVNKPLDDSKELWAVSYSKLVPVLIKAVQEQNETIETQRTEIEQLRYEIELIKKEIKDMK